MAAHFHLSILTPEQSVFEGEVEYVEAPGSEGYFGVLANHAALVTGLAEGTLKVRDADGGLAWIESKTLVNRRSVIVTAARATIRQGADEAAPGAFEAEKNVSLEYIETAPGGWVKVRHREGQVGFVRANQIWGL